MANSTSTQRGIYSPACTSKGNRYLTAYAALDARLKKYNYVPRSGVTGAYNCRQITGGTSYSLHAYGPGAKFTFWNGLTIATSLAVDINWDKNPYGPSLITDMPRGMIDEIEAIRTNNGKQVWRWGGYYTGNKDAMHFEIVCAPADLDSGIPGYIVTIPVPSNPSGDDDMTAILAKGDTSGEWWVVDGLSKRYVVTPGHAEFGRSKGLWRSANNSTFPASPEVWPQAFINEMPIVVTESWMWKLSMDLLATDNVSRDKIIEEIRKSTTTVSLSDAQLGAMVDKVTASLKADLDSIKNLDAATLEKLKALTPEAIAKKVIEEIAS